jgi:hypothetical protein
LDLGSWEVDNGAGNYGNSPDSSQPKSPDNSKKNLPDSA